MAPVSVPPVSGAAASPAAPASPEPPWLHLRPLQPGAAALSITAPAPCVLGRAAPPADVALPDDGAISARHAVLERYGERIVLRDLGSTNGTAVNGVPVEGSVVLAEGDVLRMGQTDFRVSLPLAGPPH